MKTLEILGLALLAVFAPIKAVLGVTLVLVVADFVTGVLAARARKESITSQGFKKSVMKALLYELAILMGFLVEHYLTGDFFPATKLISSLIGLTELKSMLENLDSIAGQNMFAMLIARISRQTTINEDGKNEKQE